MHQPGFKAVGARVSFKAVSHGIIVPIAAFTVRLKLRTMDLYMAPLTQVGVSTGSPASRIYTA